MSAADLTAVLLARYRWDDFGSPEDPANDHPELLQGPRLAAALRALPRRQRDRRRRADELPQARQSARGPLRAAPLVGRRRHRLTWAQAARRLRDRARRQGTRPASLSPGSSPATANSARARSRETFARPKPKQQTSHSCRFATATLHWFLTAFAECVTSDASAGSITQLQAPGDLLLRERPIVPRLAPA